MSSYQDSPNRRIADLETAITTLTRQRDEWREMAKELAERLEPLATSVSIKYRLQPAQEAMKKYTALVKKEDGP